MGCDPALFMHLGMDGLIVNLKFHKDLKKDFEETTGEKNLVVYACTLHIVHTSFKKGVSVLPIDVNQFGLDLLGSFKVSEACCEDYVKVRKLTEVTSKYVLCHSFVRWLSFKVVLVCVIEQWEHLKDCF